MTVAACLTCTRPLEDLTDDVLGVPPGRIVAHAAPDDDETCRSPRWPEPEPEPRTYVVGLPVVLTVWPGGRVTYDVDLSEAADDLDHGAPTLDGGAPAYNRVTVNGDALLIRAALAAGALTPTPPERGQEAPQAPQTSDPATDTNRTTGEAESPTDGRDGTLPAFARLADDHAAEDRARLDAWHDAAEPYHRAPW